MMRIESARRLFPRIWFNEVSTEAGREALGWYHEKKDETRSRWIADGRSGRSRRR
jgi:phage terminase large subunit